MHLEADRLESLLEALKDLLEVFVDGVLIDVNHQSLTTFVRYTSEQSVASVVEHHFGVDQPV